MAKTADGIEFFLAQVTGIEGAEGDLASAIRVLKDEIRIGDCIVESVGHAFIALAGEVPKVALAVRRLVKIAKNSDLNVRISLVAEPFPPEVAAAVARVISGETRLRPRQVIEGVFTVSR